VSYPYQELVHGELRILEHFTVLRANIRGPISSLSWNANTKSGQPSRESVR